MAAASTTGAPAMHVLNAHAIHDAGEMLTRREAAALIGVQENTLRRWYAANRGPAVVKIGTARASRVRYPRASLLAWAAAPMACVQPARPEGLPRFEPPRRGVKRQGQP
jgi:predicted DNA-binding transcriptional regulator AlpA